MTTVKVTSPGELLDALATADDIEMDGSVAGMPMITLRPGVTLRGGTDVPAVFAALTSRAPVPGSPHVRRRVVPDPDHSIPVMRLRHRCGPSAPPASTASLPSSAATAISASVAAGSTAGSRGIVASCPSELYRSITRGSM